MKKWYFILFLSLAVFTACQKNTVSKIPHISLIGVSAGDSIVGTQDTVVIGFNFTDGDGDIGVDTTSQIYVNDIRYNATPVLMKYNFPSIDGSIEDPKKGLTGNCYFFINPLPAPRLDSTHAVKGDTVTYEFYITDRAGNASNHITTHPIIIRP